MSFWQQRRVLVTGGNGFLGRYVVDQLAERGCRELFAPRRHEYDLRDAGQAQQAFALARPQIVIHLAARVGGIGANQAQPGAFFYDNMLMGLHTIEAARQAGVEKFICIGTVCAYPKWAAVPFREDELWNGFPEETNAPYGIAKRALLVQLNAYQEQYGLRSIYLIPTNLYGPGDNFQPETSHVIPAMIRAFTAAVRHNHPAVTLWGSGQVSREFLYVEDAARAIVDASERYADPAPVNIGSHQEITIAQLAVTIAQLAGFTGEIIWDRSKPDGQPRRWLDTSRAADAFGFRAATALHAGLATTLGWYRDHEDQSA